MPKVLWVPLLFCLALVIVVSSACRANAMKFHGRPPLPLPPFAGTAWYVFGDGEIDEKSAEQLLQFLHHNNVPKGSLLFINSPGGSLSGGMELGKIIRKYELFTYIGIDKKQDEYGTTSPGECYSACSLAFLGGVYRFYTDHSEYGVHRFYSSTANAVDSDTAQIISARIIQYIRDMGVDPELFNFMSRAGSTELVRINRADMERLKVVNGGLAPTKWTLESVGNALYLKGERETWRGINKFMLICDPRIHSIVLYVVYDPELRGQEIIDTMNTHSLMINDKMIPLEKHRMGPTVLVNGWINAHYIPSEDMLNQIASSRTVGIAMQTSAQSPFFMGFADMEFDGGREKFLGLRNACK